MVNSCHAPRNSIVTKADAIRAGKTHLRAFCARCRSTTDIPWQMLAGVGTDETLRNCGRRLRCKRCGERPRPADVTAWGQDDVFGGSYFGKGGHS